MGEVMNPCDYKPLPPLSVVVHGRSWTGETSPPGSALPAVGCCRCRQPCCRDDQLGRDVGEIVRGRAPARQAPRRLGCRLGCPLV